MFQIYKLRHRLANSYYNYIYDSFSFLSINDANTTTYYVFQYLGINILAFNENWEYQKTIGMDKKPTYTVLANDQIYVACDRVIFKYDKQMNKIGEIQTPELGGHRRIYFNSTDSLIYEIEIIVNSTSKINILNQSLSLVNSFNISFHSSFMIEYDGMMLISDYDTGNIYFYQNNVLVRNMTTLCNSSVNSILFDDYNHMMVLCYQSAYVYISHVNGTYTGIGFPVCNSSAHYMNFDSKDRLVILCRNEIAIFF